MTVAAVLDASVLYAAATRSVLMYLAVGGIFRALWSEAIQEEWTAALKNARPDLLPDRIARTRYLMDMNVPDAVVTGYESLVPSLELPDPNDRHVLAVAIHGGASVIVTVNLRDFPTNVLARYSLMALHPDAFLCNLLEANTQSVVAAFAADRAGLLKPPMTVDAYLTALESNGLVETVAALRPMARQL